MTNDLKTGKRNTAVRRVNEIKAEADLNGIPMPDAAAAEKAAFHSGATKDQVLRWVREGRGLGHARARWEGRSRKGRVAGRPASAGGGRRGFRLARGEPVRRLDLVRSEEHTSGLPSLLRISYAVFCLKTK